VKLRREDRHTLILDASREEAAALADALRAASGGEWTLVPVTLDQRVFSWGRVKPRELEAKLMLVECVDGNNIYLRFCPYDGAVVMLTLRSETLRSIEAKLREFAGGGSFHPPEAAVLTNPYKPYRPRRNDQLIIQETVN
jgi:hypothetical protein